jgi:antitoxin component YwqK of YwqJK toxin-antitoxin module
MKNKIIVVLLFMLPILASAQIDLKGAKITYGAENENFPIIGDTITEYYKDTNIIKKLKYRGDEKLTIIEFKNNGDKYKKAIYSLDNLMFKTVTKYHSNGNVVLIANYNKGIVTGNFQKFYDNGNPKSLGLYNKMKKEGFWKYYDENGALVKEELYKNGELVVN